MPSSWRWCSKQLLRVRSAKPASPSSAAAAFGKSAETRAKLRDQLSVILGAIIIKWYSNTAFADESRYNALVRQ
jgi:hypothetical protein